MLNLGPRDIYPDSTWAYIFVAKSCLALIQSYYIENKKVNFELKEMTQGKSEGLRFQCSDESAIFIMNWLLMGYDTCSYTGITVSWKVHKCIVCLSRART